MNWKERALFHMKSSNGLISRRSIEPILMNGCATYDESIERLKTLLEESVIEKIKSDQYSFRLTIKGDSEITPFYRSAEELMKDTFERLSKLLSGIDEVELKGGTTGVYFTYTKMSIFRFHPFKGKGKEALLFVRLPNLIGEIIDHKSNEMFLSRDILDCSSLLEEVIKSHLKMIDEYYSEEV